MDSLPTSLLNSLPTSLPSAADSPNGFLNPALYTNCTVDTCSVLTSYYNYRINLTPNIVFLVLFSLWLPVFTAIYLLKRRGLIFWLAMQAGIIAEIIGYVGRIISYNNQWDMNGYLINLVCLTLGPAFFSAAIYVCLARIVVVYGAENSRLPPKWYTRIFIPCDIVAMALQAVGAIIASIALSADKSLQTGDDFIIAGLASQVFTLFVFMALCIDFGLRVMQRRKALGDDVALVQDPRMACVRDSWKFLAFLAALGLSAVLVFWRSIYRLVELNSGFFGPVTFLQYIFVAFEGVLMLILVSVLAIFHPAICLGEAMDGDLSKGTVKSVERQTGDESVTKARNTTTASADTAEAERKIEEAHPERIESPETIQQSEEIEQSAS